MTAGAGAADQGDVPDSTVHRIVRGGGNQGVLFAGADLSQHKDMVRRRHDNPSRPTRIRRMTVAQFFRRTTSPSTATGAVFAIVQRAAAPEGSATSGNPHFLQGVLS